MKKGMLCTLLIICICIQPLMAFCEGSENSSNTAVISDDHFAAKQGDSIYYKKTSSCRKLCSLKDNLKGIATVYTEAADDRDYYVSDGWLYYFSNDKLYRVKSDGTARKLISNDKIYIDAVKDNWIYFRMDGDQSTIYRMKTDGTGKMKIAAIHYDRNLFINGNWIYFANTDDSKKMYRMGIDGKGLKKLSNSGVGAFIDVAGGWLYFKNGAYNICRIKTDGSGEQKLTQEPAGTAIISGDWIYYNYYSYSSFSKTTTYGDLYKIRTNGSGKKTIVEGTIDGISYAGNGWIYYSEFKMQVYHTASSTVYSNIFKVKTDGSSKTGVNESVIKEHNGYLYYQNLKDNMLYRKNTKSSAVTKVMDLPISYENSGGSHISRIEFDKDRIFYCGYETDRYLFKMPAGGGKEQKLTNEQFSSAYVTGSRIYYNGVDGKLYSVKPDGKGKTKVLDSQVDIITAAGDWIYYIPEPLEVSRINSSGKARQDISKATTYTEKIINFGIINGYYYYSCGDKDLYRQKEGSTKKEKLADNIHEESVLFNGNYIYYLTLDSKICRINSNTLEKQELAEDKYTATAFGIKIFEDKLFYSNYMEDKIYSIDLNNLKKSQVCDAKSFGDCSGDWIYSLQKISDGVAAITRLNIKDNTRQEVIRGNIGRFAVAGNWIFYESYADGGFYRIKADGTGKTRLNS